VLNVSTVQAASISAMLLGDCGADVIKIEHPRGDPARTHGWHREGHGLWWKVISRNKRTITRNFREPEGQELLRRLVAEVDAMVGELSARGDEEVGPRSAGAAGASPAAGDAADDRLRAGRRAYS
jgi:crotonobetainyl-CoA:carnitine CoA-transferase CaiB-like acyl-CoA transferase